MSAYIKIVLYLFFVIITFISNSYYIYIFSTLLFLSLSFKLPYKRLIKGWLFISIFLFFTFIGNLFFKLGKVICKIGPLIITEEGFYNAVIRTWRVFLMIYGAKLITITTEPRELIDGMYKLFKPLERFNINMKEFFSNMYLTMKYLPEIKEKIKGYYSDEIKRNNYKSFTDKLKLFSSSIIPFLIETLESPEKFFNKSEKDES